MPSSAAAYMSFGTCLGKVFSRKFVLFFFKSLLVQFHQYLKAISSLQLDLASSASVGYVQLERSFFIIFNSLATNLTGFEGELA